MKRVIRDWGGWGSLIFSQTGGIGFSCEENLITLTPLKNPLSTTLQLKIPAQQTTLTAPQLYIPLHTLMDLLSHTVLLVRIVEKIGPLLL